MRYSGAVVALIVGLLISAGLAGVQAVNAQSSTRPPTNLKLVGDHWTPWDPPPAGPDAYIIQKGDTLWDLSGQWLGDPFLWPQIWDENRYILDSHWIYPGDPLVIPGRPTVVPPGGPPTSEEEVEPAEEEQAGLGEGEAEEAVDVPVLVAVADPTDVYCSGYIEAEHEYSDLWVIGADADEAGLHYAQELVRRGSHKQGLGEGDVIFVSQGRNQGLSAGDEFMIIRDVREVKHPDSNQRIGSFIRRMGKARVMLTQENTSTAIIEMSCEDIHRSDELVPWQEIPIPMRASMPEFRRYDVTPSGGAIGAVVSVADNRFAAGEGHVMHTDLGAASGIAPGEVLTLYRERTELPREQLGQAVILTVEPLTSTAKITMSVREIATGDRVEIVE
jgi:hypothetical protein